jgi:endonuclease YncB( thermonuclease family)
MGICQSSTTNDKNDKNDKNYIKNLPIFIPPITTGIVIKVYDGDTITISSKVPGLKNSKVYKFSVRLDGIDTPEMKTKNLEEKAIAQLAQKALSDMILGKNVLLRNVKTEKYGRLLANVYLQISPSNKNCFGNEVHETHLNQWLLDNNYAISYDGGTKIIPTSWAQFHKDGTI